MALAVGQLVGRYRVDALVGRGGMGEVYRGFDPTLGRPVALKVVRDDVDNDPSQALARLVREARAAATFVHPRFCTLFEVVENAGRPVLVMEWIEGVTLRVRMRDGSIALDQRITWVSTLARALAEAHRAGLVHRDFKPGNVLVTTTDELKIVDFGLAKRLPQAGVTIERITATGDVLGTPRYMAPEQLAGHEANAASDQYAWAVVAYELLSGGHPGGGEIEHLARVAPHVPTTVADVIMRALEAAPLERHASLDDAVAALEKALTTSNRPPRPGTRGGAPDATGSGPPPAEATRTVVAPPPHARQVRLLVVSGGLGFALAALVILAVVVRARTSGPVARASPGVGIDADTSAVPPPMTEPPPPGTAAATDEADGAGSPAPPEPALPVGRSTPRRASREIVVVTTRTSASASVSASASPAPPPPASRAEGPLQFRISDTNAFMTGFSDDEIRAAFEPFLPQIQACYPETTEHQSLNLLVTVGTDGVPFEVDLGHVRSKDERACTERFLQRIRLPPNRTSKPTTVKAEVTPRTP